MLRKGRTLHRLSNLVKPKEITSISEKNDACSFANYATKDKPSEEATSRLYKSLGMKPPKPRRQSMEARRLNAV